MPYEGELAQRTESTIEWMHAPELWVLILVVLPLIVLGVWWIYSGERGLGLFRRVLLTGLRATLLLSLVAILCEPILTTERVQTRSGQILLMVDASYSMGIADRYTEPELRNKLETAAGNRIDKTTQRIDLVSGVLSNRDLDFIDRLREKGNLRVVSCSDGTRTFLDAAKLEGDDDGESYDALRNVELRGKVTRLGDSINEAVNELRGEDISAVVLFTDGRDNGGVLRPEEAARRLAKRSIQLYTVGVGNSEEPKDVRLFGFDLPEVVLEGDVVSVDFNLLSEGFEGERVKARLQLLDEGGIPVGRGAEEFFVLGKSGEVQTERLEFRPQNSGRFLARLEVDVLEGELFEENNSLEKPITVLSQKIKVLYVEGLPRYEYRYLKNALILDPTMESQCLLLSADKNFVQESSPGVPTLSRFPQSREDLFEYHLVILGDVPPEDPKLPVEWKSWLKDFVDDIGGGVVFLSGPGYLPQKYRGTEIEKLLPVELGETQRSGLNRGGLEREFTPKRTPEGREHPVMQFTGDPEQDATLWGEVLGREHRALPGFYWYSRVKQLKRGGVALAVHSDESENHFKYGPRPIFAYQYYGRGRTFISLVDSTWRWRRNVGNFYFYKFWGQVIRFASAGRLLGKTQRFSVAVDQREYTLGSQIRILARALNPEFKPTGEDEATVFVQRMNDAESEPTVLTAVRVPARPAYYSVSIEARELGDHKVWLEEKGEEVATTSYRVVVPQLEYEEPRMDRERLLQIAELTGGAYYGLEDVGKLPDDIVELESEIPISSEQKPLWDRSLFMLLFVLVISVEWILRKVFRLL